MVLKSKVIPIRAIPVPYTDPDTRYDPERDGVTFSLLNGWKQCRELVRRSLQGYAGKFPSFALTFGGIAHHILREAYEGVLIHQDRRVPTDAWFRTILRDTSALWYHENPTKNEKAVQIFEEAMMKISATMPAYFKYWKTDFTTRCWMDVENEFRIPYTFDIPGIGTTTRVELRGKIDGLFTRPKGKRHKKAPRLIEHKTRSQIDEQQLVDTMPMNLQTGIYILAAWELTKVMPVEVEMNIIRKTALRQGKAETMAQFETRIRADVAARPDWYFVRMGMDIDPEDVYRMQTEIKTLIRDFLFWWYGVSGHYRNDASCYLFHRPCDMIRICAYNDYSGVFRRRQIFSELED